MTFIDCEEPIKYLRPKTDSRSDLSKFLYLSTLGSLLYIVFDSTEKAEYLDKSITCFSVVLEPMGARLTRFVIIQRHIESQFTCRCLDSDLDDLDRTMHLLASGVRDPCATVLSRFNLA
jgi:hypothetical protein